MLAHGLRAFCAEVVAPVTACVYARAARFAALAEAVLAREGGATPAAAATRRDLATLRAMRRAEAAVYSADHTRIERPPASRSSDDDDAAAVPIGGLLAGVLLRLHNECATALRHWRGRV